MTIHNRLIHLMLLAIAFVLGSGSVAAQGLTIDITNGNPSALPVAVVPSPRVRSSTTTSAGAERDAVRHARYCATVAPEKTRSFPARASAASSPRRTDS